MMASKLFLCLFIICYLFITIQTASISYDGFGTFNTLDFFDPIHRPINLLPKHPDVINATFSLYTRKNLQNPETYNYNPRINRSQSFFDSNKSTKLIIHGYNEDAREWMHSIKNNYLQLEDLNIILVEWPNGDDPPYVQAVANSQIVGIMVGKFIEFFKNIPLENVHIIGHSLGSHIAGYAGKYLRGRVGRITALDPAGPLFEGVNNSAARLWDTDAQFVDSIHTDRGHDKIPFTSFGMYETCSHISIFVNGAEKQPGCPRERLNALLFEESANRTRHLVFCAHVRSVEYFIETIIPDQLIAKPIAYQCQDWSSFQNGECHDCGLDGSKCVELGPNAEKNRRFKNKSRGHRFFMATGDSPKYIRFQYLITIRMAQSSSENRQAQNAKIFLEFQNNRKNQKQQITFNSNYQKFEYGTNYSQVIVSEINYNQFDSIIMNWSHGPLIELITRSMFVDSIQIISLSEIKLRNKNQQRNIEMIFRPESIEITNRNGIKFHKV
uniref:Pancreatic triacylglycerol lipase-like n=1 Tax=Dermatophagoides pteronyssinus TaxID=6956 RepID=A0A6P6XWU6_DERPT|nr:pancreatic triacylglycerol lipase-like [Dermatophagoides pteronyssinus]